MTLLINKICNKFNLETNINKISVIDIIIFTLNYNKINKIMINHTSISNTEKYITKLFSSSIEFKKQVLSENYFNNLLSYIYLIIGNPYSIDTIYFNAIYENYELLEKVPAYIIYNYDIIMNDTQLYKFYNSYLVQKWINTIMQKPVTKNNYYNVSKLNDKQKKIKWIKYKYIWKKYNNICLIVKKYLLTVNDFYLTENIKVVGCYNVDSQLYSHCLKSHTGLDLNIVKLEKWALNKLNELTDNLTNTLKKINPDIKTFKNPIKVLHGMSIDQLFKSKKEYIDYHRDAMNKYEDIFINKFNYPNYEKSNLILFEDKNLGLAHYNENNFYLNCYYWKTAHKYRVESLVLHETIPGHHTQVHVSKYINSNENVLLSYFPSVCNAFVEGYALFCEKLGVDQTNWDKTGQINFEILRTLRVIVDIRIHHKGYTPTKIINYMKKYVSFDINDITNEVYRYVCYPGQAVSYAIGSQFFKKVIEKKNISNLHCPKAIKIYKKIILSGPKPLQFLLDEYNLTIDELFE